MSYASFATRSVKLRVFAAAVFSAALAISLRGQVSMLTQHNDIGRSGANLQETQLNVANVNATKFGLLFEMPVTGEVYAQPLYVPNLNGHNTLFIATMEDNLYAFDADTGAPLWSENLGTPVSYLDTVKPGDALFVASNPQPGQLLLSQFPTDIDGDIGILSTPVINGTTLYCVAQVKNPTSGEIYFVLYAIDTATGNIINSIDIGNNRPLNQFYVCGTRGPLPPGAEPEASSEAFTPFSDPAAFSSAFPNVCDQTIGKIVFDAQLQLNRPALLFLNNQVYVAFGGHGDYNYKPLPHVPVLNDPEKASYYHGWVMSFDATTLQLVNIFNTTKDLSWGPVMNNDGTVATDGSGNPEYYWREGWGGAIWQSGQGLASDGSYLYLMTGNGSFHQAAPNVADVGDNNLAMSLLQLDPNLNVVGQFIPPNTFFENLEDMDFGSSGPTLIAGPKLIVGGGKTSTLFSFNTSAPSQAASQIQVSPSDNAHHIHGAPVYWTDAGGVVHLFVWPEESPLNDLQLDASGNFTLTATSAFQAPLGMPGAALSVSANGTDPNSAILWASLPLSQNANEQTVTGVLRAFNAAATSGGQLTEIWNSINDDTRSPDNFAKFCPMTVVNGKVYRATFSNKVSVYGLKYAASAATYQSLVAPGSIVTAFGTALATATANATTVPLPTNLSGTTVTVKDSAGVSRLAPLYSVSPTQVIYQVPPGTALGAATVTITTPGGVAAMGAASIVSVAPGLFSADASGSGLAAGEMFKPASQSLELLSSAGNYFNATSAPGYLVLYGTGMDNAQSMTVTVGGVSVPIISAGPQGYYPGEDQVVLGPLPASLQGAGPVSVALTVNGLAANTVMVNFAATPIFNVNYTSLVAYNPATLSITSPVAGVIWATPNPVQVCDGSGIGAATLSWVANGVSTVEVHAGSPSGPIIAQTGASGTQAIGKLIPNGTVFFLQNTSGGLPLTAANTLSTVTVALTSAGCPGNGASFVSQSVPTTMTHGQNYNVSVTLQNTGSSTWLNAAASAPGTEYVLAATNYPGPWSTSLVELPNSVSPGAQVTLNFTVKAPATAGTYAFQWCMVQLGTAQWFGSPTTAVNVTVH